MAPGVISGLTGLGWVAYNSLRSMFSEHGNEFENIDRKHSSNNWSEYDNDFLDKEYNYESPVNTEAMKLMQLTQEKSTVSSLMDSLHKVSLLMDKALSFAGTYAAVATPFGFFALCQPAVSAGVTGKFKTYDTINDKNWKKKSLSDIEQHLNIRNFGDDAYCGNGCPNVGHFSRMGFVYKLRTDDNNAYSYVTVPLNEFVAKGSATCLSDRCTPSFLSLSAAGNHRLHSEMAALEYLLGDFNPINPSVGFQNLILTDANERLADLAYLKIFILNSRLRPCLKADYPADPGYSRNAYLCTFVHSVKGTFNDLDVSIGVKVKTPASDWHKGEFIYMNSCDPDLTKLQILEQGNVSEMVNKSILQRPQIEITGEG